MKKQLIILWIGIGLVVLAGLFPPFWHSGYDFIFSRRGSVDLTRLAAEILIIGLLTAGALYTNRVISEEARRRLKLVIKFFAWGVVVIVLCVVTLICVFRVINWQAKKVQPSQNIRPEIQKILDETEYPGSVVEQPAPPVLPMFYTTIHEAAKQGELADVKRHLQKGADVNARDKDGDTPLMWAAVYGQMDVVKYLVDKGADVNARGKYGDTPLIRSEDYRGNLEVAKYLVDKGADVNARNEGGFTPLMKAANASHPLELVKYLVSKGARVNVMSTSDFTPLNMAKRSGKQDVIEFLKQHGAKE